MTFRNVLFLDASFFRCQFENIKIEGFFDSRGLSGRGRVQIPFSIRNKVNLDYKIDSIDVTITLSRYTNLHRSSFFTVQSVGKRYVQMALMDFRFFYMHALKQGLITKEDIFAAFPSDQKNVLFLRNLIVGEMLKGKEFGYRKISMATMEAISTRDNGEEEEEEEEEEN